mgnify:CR=1 FL=1
MKPDNLKTKIFLDSGDPKETQEALNILGYLDGQTTNPTLISKNPQAKERLERGNKFTKEEIFTFYKKVIKEISALIPEGSISIEVYADAKTSADDMYIQGKEMFAWIPNAHIKYPITSPGLLAAERLIREGMRVNMTLCFSQEQAAAVYAATKGAKKGDVFISPFVGRLDDKGENGMNLITNILRMYNDGDGHVEVLTASVRSLEHFLYALNLESDIITVPLSILKEWAGTGPRLKAIKYSEIAISKPWTGYNIAHELTEKGMQKFSNDWNELIK